MSLSPLPLSYCTNVHPGRSVAQVMDGLDRYTVRVQQALGHSLAAGLWLAKPVVSELLATPDGVRRFASELAQRGLTCHTLNAFPFGDFHSARVKENVYLPDWSTAQRLQYTLDCASVLAELLPAGVEGTISTVPLGFKALAREGLMQAAIARVLECARGLHQLHAQSGKLVRLAIEPEPLCIIETTDEAIRFFKELWKQAGDAIEVVRAHIGLCYDVCHQAVEFEDVAASIASLDSASVRINKVHISCALELTEPASNREGRAALKPYVEERYLHQTIARTGEGKILRVADLNEKLIDRPDADFLAAHAWRIHFHVPVHAQRLGALATTQADLKKALIAVRDLDYSPHLEVETYTWEVLPDACQADLAEGLTREMAATEQMLKDIAGNR
jgi:hypothetical protein